VPEENSRSRPSPRAKVHGPTGKGTMGR
jgi:hypothetical protein